MSAEAQALPLGGFRHEAFLYDGTDDYATGALGFIRDGLAADEVVLVAVPPANADVLRDGLGPDGREQHANGGGSQVRFLDMTEVGRNPGRLIPLWLEFVALNLRAGCTVRGIGEPIWAARSAAEVLECQWHESLLNLAFANAPLFPLMCPYDRATLDPAVLEEACRSHPYLLQGGVYSDSAFYRGAPAPDSDLDSPLPAPPASAVSLGFSTGELSRVRAAVHTAAAAHDLDRHRIVDLVTAVNEVATNSLRHGGGHGTLHAWSGPNTLVFEVSDGGRIGQALAGRRPTAIGAVGGRGLWLVHQLCDLVEVRSGARGTTVRMSAYLSL
jgi:anti-sigma regulatory factor (Ser/Thr protein kinase)